MIRMLMKRTLFCFALGLLGVMPVFAAPALEQTGRTQPNLQNIFTPAFVKPDLLGATAGSMSLTGTGNIRFFQAFL